MIPPFNDNGYLPSGIHSANLDEVQARFGRPSALRRVQMESVHAMIDLAQGAGVERIVLSGGFVSDIMEPGDVDCVLLLVPGRRRNRDVVRELRSGLPFLDIALVSQRDLDGLVLRSFACAMRAQGVSWVRGE